MKAKVILFSNKSNEITDFLNKFYSNKSDHGNSTSWKKEFPNPSNSDNIIKYLFERYPY